MRLTHVELHPHGADDVIELSFRDPTRQNPYNVKMMFGLDADNIVPRYYKSTGDSAKHYILSLEDREVVVRVELNPRYNLGESYSSLRDHFYRMIASSRTGKVHVHLKNEEGMIGAIDGFVKKIEAPLFEKLQQIQVTIECDDAMIRGMMPIEVDVTELDPAETVVTDSLSTAPHGMKFELEFLADLAAFRIYTEQHPAWEFSVTPVGGFLTGDILHFSSEYHKKHLYVTRDSETIHIADAIDPGSVWPILFPGANEFSIDDPSGVSWSLISYHTAYWGV